MRKHSIFLKISISFFIALLAITALFYVIQEHEYAHEKEKLREHYHHMAMEIMKWKMGKLEYSQLIAKLKKNNITLIRDAKLHQDIKKLVSSDKTSCAIGDFYIYQEDSFRYIVIPPIFGQILLKDATITPLDVSYVWWLYGAFILIMLLLFASITISLYPLKKLQKQIQLFGEGDANRDFFLDREDEIAQLSNEFHKALQKTNSVLEARKVFLINITHELKTPVTSGKIALELLENSKSKEVLQNVFTRIELLLKEFIQIEKITATADALQTKEYPLTDILDQASDMLFLEQNSIKNNCQNNTLEVDFELFTFVFKNLIDNGLKYSVENDFYIECSEDKISFISRGKKMDKPLSYYLQPFIKSENSPSQSFGLGLYIVDAILKKHNFRLSYEHQDNYNYFIISK